MKKYITPEIYLNALASEDVIATSTGYGDTYSVNNLNFVSDDLEITVF